ncbi:MAG: DUF4190 domain-containing protein [Methylococcales bacterium]
MSTPAKETSAMAIVSLISGILSWTLLPFFLPAVVAIITGHMARKEIRNNTASKEGDGLALTGLILGWVNIACWILGIIFFGGLILAALGFGIAASSGG